MKITRTVWQLIPALGLLIWFLGTAAAEPPSAAQIVYQASSPFYDTIYVVDDNDLRSLRFGSVTGDDQSVIRLGQPLQLPMPYLRTAAVGLTVPKSTQRVLIIGLGGGGFASFVRARMPEVQIDAVEIDPVVAQIAREYFSVLEGNHLRVHVMDAVYFVQQDNEPYDYILLDAYDADEIPEALVTASFLSEVRANLASGGVVVANVAIASETGTEALIRKLAGHFGHCLQLRSPPHLNDVLLLAAQPLPTSAELRDSARRFDEDSESPLDLESYAATASRCPGGAHRQ
ncbi:MAG TPA: fused MFS/spermidine synthase [Pseudomonadales bacterium]|nr:fused MFS/spermidine synthase [Pseudomonadales bacterium]